jgi:hypothetical protein
MSLSTRMYVEKFSFFEFFSTRTTDRPFFWESVLVFVHPGLYYV